MRVLLHTCCAPCLIKCANVFQNENITPVLFWYNPNIHPYTEYKSRKDALMNYAKSENLEVYTVDNYGLRGFITDIHPDFNNRCEYCYKLRLEETASFALKHGYTAFSTTLLISPYQKHEFIHKAACEAAEKYGIEFIYRDFRPYFREGLKTARELKIYMQKYCGCIFSEEERYLKTGSGKTM